MPEAESGERRAESRAQKAMATSIQKAIYVLPINLLNTLAPTNTIFTSNCCCTMQLDGEGVDEGEGVCSNKKWQCVYFSVEFSLGKSQIDPPHLPCLPRHPVKTVI